MVVTMGMIFYLSHQPGDLIQLPQVVGLDKAAHALAYGILAATFLYGLQPFIHDANRTVFAILIVLFCLLFGIGDEFHQSFIPGRSVSGWDVVADGVGGLLVVGLWHKRLASKI